jgi:hypothetical protein
MGVVVVTEIFIKYPGSELETRGLASDIANRTSYLSKSEEIDPPGVLYMFLLYTARNRAHRTRLEKLLYIGLSRSPNGFFFNSKHFWIQV